MTHIEEKLKEYVENNIIPKYVKFDKAHNLSHVYKVINRSLEIAQDYDVNWNLVYVIAAYHDIGLEKGREDHEKNSGLILSMDENLTQWFSQDEILLMKEAVEDHRASNKYEPRSIYGKIVAEADRNIDYHTILLRSIQYGLHHNPEYDTDQQFQRIYEHILKKYGEGGYLKLWLNTEENTMGLKEIRRALNSKDSMRKDFDKILASLE
ncbi:HD domain-containing protein [Alkaliphilus crotonatoxidans]